ncbi:MAG: FliM/FliN family flagellar motor switch protein, partial [Myxococcota bacterium]
MSENLLNGAPPDQDSGSIDRLYDVSVDVTVELGRRRLTIGEVLELKPGSTVE